MNAPSVDIKAMINAEPSVNPNGVTINIGELIATPINLINIRDTEGSSPLLTIGGNTEYEYPAIQIIIRHTDYLAGWQLADSIKNLLHGRANETWGTTFYALIKVLNGPNFLGTDSNLRMLFSVNLNIQRRPTT
jgi:hypothetical protein